MAEEYGHWIKEPRVADCPVDGEDSIGVRYLGGSDELRRCSEGHEFTAQAYVTSSQGEATRFNL